MLISERCNSDFVPDGVSALLGIFMGYLYLESGCKQKNEKSALNRLQS